MINSEKNELSRKASQTRILVFLLLVVAGCNHSDESSSDRVAEQGKDNGSAAEIQGTKKESSAEKGKQKQTSPPPQTKKMAVEFPAFLDAALEGNLDTVRRGIKGGIDVNRSDDQQRTALMLAAFNGHTTIVKLMLDEGAKLDHRDAMGRTALMFAATADNVETLKLLLDVGADVNAVDTGEGFTPLMHAAAEGQLEVVQILLKHKADPTVRDVDGDTARDFASQNGHSEVVKLLSQ